MSLKALVIGATGATGKELVQLLLLDSNYELVTVFVRKSTGLEHPKFKEHIINFDTIESIKELLVGDVLFSCLGTTMAIAKTKENQYKVDFTYQYNFAKLATENGVRHYVLISSIGAAANSMNFYLKMKGELDEAITQLSFESISILRPGPIDAAGNRPENRSMEKSSINALRFVNKFGLFKKYAPITTQQLALAMTKAVNKEKIIFFESLDIFKLIE